MLSCSWKKNNQNVKRGTKCKKGDRFIFSIQKNKSVPFLLSAALVLTLGVSGRAGADAANLRDQLRDLARAQGFEVRGLELVKRQPARIVTGDLRHQIKRMLTDYNHVVIGNDAGGIDKVIILSPGTGETVYPEQSAVQSVTTPGEHIVPARRRCRLP